MAIPVIEIVFLLGVVAVVDMLGPPTPTILRPVLTRFAGDVMSVVPATVVAALS